MRYESHAVPDDLSTPIAYAACVWIAAIETGYAAPASWIPWADRQIEALDRPTDWLIEVCLATNRDAALSALGALPVEISWPTDYVALYLGFLFLCYERGDCSLLDLLIASGRKTDGSSYDVDCEAFYLLANEIDGGGPTVPSSEPLETRVTALFAPCKELSVRLWADLQN